MNLIIFLLLIHAKIHLNSHPHLDKKLCSSSGIFPVDTNQWTATIERYITSNGILTNEKYYHVWYFELALSFLRTHVTIHTNYDWKKRKAVHLEKEEKKHT